MIPTIPRNLHGRRVIFTSAAEITASNVRDELRKALVHHAQNREDIDYLYQYYTGNQPILSRIKEIRPEINNKIVENHALEIVDFKKGYVFGEPVQYVRRGDSATASDDITTLNEYMFIEDKASQDKELAEWFYICGTGYRAIFPNETPEDEDGSPFELFTLDPRDTFVVYYNDIKREPAMGITYVKGDTGIKYTVYTKNEYFVIENDVFLEHQPHAIGDIPIVEYPANSARIGAFEAVTGLLDAINNVVSNRMDGLEQFVQSFMKFINCEIREEQFAQLKALGAIQVYSEPGLPADVQFVAQELDQSHTQTVKTDLYQMLLIICGMPDRKSSGGGDTGQAVMLRDGWSDAEARAKDTELVFKRSEKRMLRIALRIIRDTVGSSLNLHDIDVKFTRNKSDNLLVKAQGLQNLLEAGVNPRIAIGNVGLFSDPEQVYIDSEEYLEKWKTPVDQGNVGSPSGNPDSRQSYTPSNNKANPED